MEHTDCCFLFDNEALYSICNRSLDMEKPNQGWKNTNTYWANTGVRPNMNEHGFFKNYWTRTNTNSENEPEHPCFFIPEPNYESINRLIAQVISSTTASLRFKGDLDVDLDEVRNNLVPYSRLHFPVVSYAQDKIKDKVNTLDEFTGACFNANNVMASIDPKDGKYMSCFLLARGDVASSEVNMAIKHIKKNSWVTKFLDSNIIWWPST